MRYQSAQFKGGNITFGAFRPNDDVVAMLPASEQVRVDAAMAEALRARVSGPVQAVDGRFYLGADPSAPRIGDMRVSYRAVPAGAVSIVGRQSGSDFADYQTHAGDKLLIVKPGTKSAIEMFNTARSENKMWTWIIRIVGAAMMFVGFQLIFAPLVVVADVVPMIGNVLGAGASLVSFIATAVLAPLVIAIAWLWYRPLVSITVLAVGGALAFGGLWLRGRHKTAARPTASASAQQIGVPTS
jgi:Transmembrane protein 43